MDIQKQSHEIRYRQKPKDKYYTPPELAKELIKLVPILDGDYLIDPCSGKGAFFYNYPEDIYRRRFEIDDGNDWFDNEMECDWIITNPPYSNLNLWLESCRKHCRKGFALLLGMHAITPKRLDEIEKAGFGLTKMHFFKVMQWYGLSTFLIFEKNKKSIITTTRKIYQT